MIIHSGLAVYGNESNLQNGRLKIGRYLGGEIPEGDIAVSAMQADKISVFPWRPDKLR